jgi:uncharacterized membrane protein YeaQ/YmgE (transglycosylase-associated protein family)
VIFFVVLATGFAAGLVATLLIPGKRKLSLSATTLVGIVGAGAGLTIAELAGGGTTIARFLLAVAGAVVVLLLAETAKTRLRPVPGALPATVAELIADGESATVELKGSARRNQHTGERDERLELTIAKSVAGFLNADGGTLLIGVADDGLVVGIEGDYSVTNKGNRDGFELWLRDYLGQRLGVEALHDVVVSFVDVDGADVGRVDVARASKPVFLAEPGGRRTADLYVRIGNSTRRLLTNEAIAYTARRFPGYAGD